MSTIKSITPTMYNNQPDGGYEVVINDNGKEVKGSIGKTDKKSDKGLRVGDEVTYSENPWTSKQGKTINFLTVNIAKGGSAPQSNQPSQPQGGQAKAPTAINAAQMKFDARIKCMELAHDAYVAGKLDNEESKTHAREWVTLADDLINDIFKG